MKLSPSSTKTIQDKCDNFIKEYTALIKDSADLYTDLQPLVSTLQKPVAHEAEVRPLMGTVGTNLRGLSARLARLVGLVTEMTHAMGHITHPRRELTEAMRHRDRRSGELLCPSCGHPMVPMRRCLTHGDRIYMWYVCPRRNGEQGCGHVEIERVREVNTVG
ncbi:MAG: hypothetical protein JW937_06445 [Candidatus Omnitrophica bacterium]|nr:hypothetical protein [Candidatus Omnitrophota bacterium]